MIREPLVTVIIPTYNRAAIVGRAVDSVLGQTYRAVEVIVIDDGSTDHTQATLAAYGDRIRVIRQENAGPAIARNRGVSAATGEIIAFLDSDDSWLPEKLERQVRAMEEAGPSVPCCLCNCAVAYENGARTSTFDIAGTVPNYSAGIWLNPAEVLQTRFVMFNQAVAIRRDVLDRIGAFDARLRFCEDYELPLRLALEGPWVIIRDELVVYQTASQGSWAAKALREEIRMREDLLQIRKEILDRIEKERRGGRLRALARRELRRAERELKVARLSHRGPAGATIGRALRFVERVRKATFRRTPGYPRMVVRELPVRS